MKPLKNIKISEKIKSLKRPCGSHFDSQIYTSRSTKYCACHVQTSHVSKVTIHCTCHEIRARRRSPPCPKCCTGHHQSTRFPLRLPQKMTIVSEHARDTTTRAQSRQAPTAPAQILRACAVEMHFDDFERHMNVL